MPALLCGVTCLAAWLCRWSRRRWDDLRAHNELVISRDTVVRGPPAHVEAFFYIAPQEACVEIWWSGLKCAGWVRAAHAAFSSRFYGRPRVRDVPLLRLRPGNYTAPFAAAE